MLARKIILGFAISILVPLALHYALELMQPSPNWSDATTEIARARERETGASAEEAARLRADREHREDELRDRERAAAQLHFFGSVPIGLLVMLLGWFVRRQPLGEGFLMGGLLSFTDGCYGSWQDVPAAGRVATMAAALLVSVVIAYRLVRKEPRVAVAEPA